jgi:c(7)-type cytochrome triheme protein
MSKPPLYLVVLFLLLAGPAFSQVPISQETYGTVVINNYSHEAGLAPVVFDHWLHRAKFTCRLCHIDIGFTMKTDGTAIRAADNMSGYYCGSCHDGERVYEGRKIFAACAEEYTEEEGKRCTRCHSSGKTGVRQYEFRKFTADLPRLFGSLIDWEKAAEEGKIKPVDYLEGISPQRNALQAQKDFSIPVRSLRWADVIFSHKKHIAWNGCEVCHPMIYQSSKQGSLQYSMADIMDGESCGVCHVSVAFTVWLCRKCHTNTVE